MSKKSTQSKQTHFEEMLELATHLVDNAKKLRSATNKSSAKSIEEKDLEVMQHKQHEMIGRLVELEHSIKANKEESCPQELQKEIEAKLVEFQKVNREYVEELRLRLSMIQFTGRESEGSK